MERREFLKLLSVSAASAPLLDLMGCAAVPTTRPREAVGKGFVSLFLAADDRRTSRLRLLNWDTFQHVDYPIPLSNPHSLVMDDRGSGTAYLFETFGSALRVDLGTSEMRLRDHSKGKEMFFGHGTTNSTGDFVFCTEMDPKTGISTITSRASRDLSLAERAPKEAEGSHQVVSLPGGKLLACGNQFSAKDGSHGAVTFLNSTSLKVEQRIELDFPVVHLVPLSETEVVALGMRMQNKKQGGFKYSRSSFENTPDLITTAKFEPTPLVYAKSDGTHRVFWDVEKKELFQFNFGIARVPDGNSFLTGHAASNSVFAWKDFEISKSVSVDRPMNIAVSDDGTEFMVVSHDRVKVFDMKTFKELRTMTDTGVVIALSGYKSISHRVAPNS